jgi:hypothetical protein
MADIKHGKNSGMAYAVSISNGLCMKNLIIKKAFLLAFMFGFFQALMPFLGFIFEYAVSNIIARYAPFVRVCAGQRPGIFNPLRFVVHFPFIIFNSSQGSPRQVQLLS